MIKIKKLISAGVFLPAFIFAQIAYPQATTQAIVAGLAKLIGIIAAIVALVFIFLGLFKFATSRGDPKAIDEAKVDILWGGLGIIIALLLFNINTVMAWFGITWATP